MYLVCYKYNQLFFMKNSRLKTIYFITFLKKTRGKYFLIKILTKLEFIFDLLMIIFSIFDSYNNLKILIKLYFLCF